jgi:hypothetical protein
MHLAKIVISDSVLRVSLGQVALFAVLSAWPNGENAFLFTGGPDRSFRSSFDRNAAGHGPTGPFDGYLMIERGVTEFPSEHANSPLGCITMS